MWEWGHQTWKHTFANVWRPKSVLREAEKSFQSCALDIFANHFSRTAWVANCVVSCSFFLHASLFTKGTQHLFILAATGFWVQFQLRAFSLWSLHVWPVPARVLSIHSGFIPQFKDMHAGLIGNLKLTFFLALRWSGAVSRVKPHLLRQDIWDSGREEPGWRLSGYRAEWINLNAFESCQDDWLR